MDKVVAKTTIDADELLETTKCYKLEMYIESLSEKEKKAYIIAKTHLGDSFSLEKCVGFIEFSKNH